MERFLKALRYVFAAISLVGGIAGVATAAGTPDAQPPDAVPYASPAPQALTAPPFATDVSAAAAATKYALPNDRSVAWKGNVGVPNDIPARTIICASLTPSGLDDASAIQAAIDQCPAGQVVTLDAGTYQVGKPVVMKSGVTMRGSGMGKTIIAGASTFVGSYLIGFDGAGSSWNLSNTTPVNLKSTSKGSLTIATKSPHGWQVGDLIVIDQMNNPQGDPVVSNTGSGGTCTWCGREYGQRALGQVAKIKSLPSTTTARLEIPLYWSYTPTLASQGVKVTGVTRSAGIESLTVDNSLSGNEAQTNGATVYMGMTDGCWLLGVEIIGSYRNGVRVYCGYRNTIRGCRFHEGVPATPVDGAQYSSGRAYGIYLNVWASANLIEDNEFYHLSVGFTMDGVVSGNVIAYNYLHDLYSNVTYWQGKGLNVHGSHPMMNLFESNYAVRMTAGFDDFWGTSSHNTLYRNRITNSTLSCGPWAVDIFAYNWYYNAVGNVIGTETDTVYELDNVDFYYCNGANSDRAIFKLGYLTASDASAAGNDEKVKATLLRHGNWDSVTKSTIWNGTDSRTLPSSFYLNSKPSWWGTTRWPAIGPDRAPMYPPAPSQGMPW